MKRHEPCPFAPCDFEPGAHLLYGPTTLIGRLISFRTWSPACHVEVYVGNGMSVASRWQGVDMYPTETAALIGVLYPRQSLNIQKALNWFNEPYDHETHHGVRGRPFGLKTLLRFYNMRCRDNGWICSEFASFFDHESDFYPFSREYYAGAVDPGDYFMSPSFHWHWVSRETRVALGKF